MSEHVSSWGSKSAMADNFYVLFHPFNLLGAHSWRFAFVNFTVHRA